MLTHPVFQSPEPPRLNAGGAGCVLSAQQAARWQVSGQRLLLLVPKTLGNFTQVFWKWKTTTFDRQFINKHLLTSQFLGFSYFRIRESASIWLEDRISLLELSVPNVAAPSPHEALDLSAFPVMLCQRTCMWWFWNNQLLPSGIFSHSYGTSPFFHRWTIYLNGPSWISTSTLISQTPSVPCDRHRGECGLSAFWLRKPLIIR